MNRGKLVTILMACLAIVIVSLALGAGYSTANYSEQGGAKWIVGGGGLTGELLIDADGTFHFEGATADGYETAFAVVDPTADRTVTLPDYTGGMPIVISQFDCDDVNTISTSYVDITEATITLPANWFSVGKSIKITVAGSVTGDNDRIHLSCYMHDSDQCELVTTDATGANGEFIASWIVYATSTTAQRIVGTLYADNGAQAVVVYDTDTQAFTSEGTIKIRAKVDNAGDDLAANYGLIDHWVK